MYTVNIGNGEARMCAHVRVRMRKRLRIMRMTNLILSILTNL